MTKYYPFYIFAGIWQLVSFNAQAQIDEEVCLKQPTRVGFEVGGYLCNRGVMVGYRSGYNMTADAQFNTFVGLLSGYSVTTGSSNIMIGTNAGRNSTTGTANFFIGDNSGGGNITGGFNVYLGTNAGDGPGVNGDNNIAIGFESGRANVAGVNNTFLGFRADAGANGLSNATAIGNSAKVNVSNAVVLGNGANVGIGTSSPTARLHVSSGIPSQSGLRLENLNADGPASSSANKFLTVDGNGNVILATYAGGARESSAETLWQRKGSFLESVNSEALIIGQGVTKTPADYNLFVSKGILTEKVKVAVKNTSEWSDKVFEKDYQLKSLTEVEQYIKQTGHLPGVASAAEMVEQGNNLHKTDAKLLEKIEELTLYVIQQEKESLQQKVVNRHLQESIKSQQTEIDDLKKLVKQILDKK